MKEQIYQAFADAGLEFEARTLFINVNGKVVSCLGRCIAFVDDLFDSRSTRKYRLGEKDLIDSSVRQIKDYVANLCATGKDPEKLEKAKILQSKLNEILE